MKANNRSIAIFGILAVAAIGAFIYFKKRKEKTAAAGEAQELPSTTETSSTTSTQAAQKIKVRYRDKNGGTVSQNATQALIDRWLLLSVNNDGTGNYTLVNAITGGSGSDNKWLLKPNNQSATPHFNVGTFDGQQFKTTLRLTNKTAIPAAADCAAWAIVYNKNDKQIYLVEPESARAVGLIK